MPANMQAAGQFTDVNSGDRLCGAACLLQRHGDRHGGSKAERLGFSQCVPVLLGACVGVVHPEGCGVAIACSDAVELQTAHLQH